MTQVISPEFLAHLNSGSMKLCYCVRIEPANRDPLGFTSHDADVIVGGLAYSSTPSIAATDAELSIGGATSNMDFSGVLDSELLREVDLDAGIYDGAGIEIRLVRWDAPEQNILLLAGKLGAISRGERAFTAEVRSLASLLNQAAGRWYTGSCDATLGDSRCRVNLAPFTATVTVSSREGNLVTLSGLPNDTEDFYGAGKLTILSGDFLGLVFDLSAHSPGGRVKLRSTPTRTEVLTAGDTVQIVAGCRKAFSVCRDKFNNVLNFRGFPHIPGDDYLVRYANTGDNNAGGPVVS